MNFQSAALADESKTRILSAAEALFARRAIESVSFREIARLAGHRNTNAVQHHFTDRDGLVQAIFAWRVTQMEGPRGRALEAADRAGKPLGISALLRVLCEPVLDLTDDDGHHTYAGFMSQYLLHHRPAGVLHASDTRPELSSNLNEIQRRLFDAIGVSDPAMFDYRIATVYLIVMNAIVLCDNEKPDHDNKALVRSRFEEAIRMASAALKTSI
jgi:AcrR family transcriptional regulator